MQDLDFVKVFVNQKKICIFAETKHRHTFLYGLSRSSSGFYFNRL